MAEERRVDDAKLKELQGKLNKYKATLAKLDPSDTRNYTICTEEIEVLEKQIMDLQRGPKTVKNIEAPRGTFKFNQGSRYGRNVFGV